MAGCLAARTAKSTENEPPPCFALGVAPCATPSRSYHPMGCDVGGASRLTAPASLSGRTPAASRDGKVTVM